MRLTLSELRSPVDPTTRIYSLLLLNSVLSCPVYTWVNESSSTYDKSVSMAPPESANSEGLVPMSWSIWVVDSSLPVF